METVKINPGQIVGAVKPMHAVNNGPISGRKTQKRSNFETFKEARIPYSRNHDASFCPTYGGENIVDVHAVFKNFDADPYDPAPSSPTFTVTPPDMDLPSYPTNPDIVIPDPGTSGGGTGSGTVTPDPNPGTGTVTPDPNPGSGTASPSDIAA